VDLSDGQIVRCSPPGVKVGEFGRCQDTTIRVRSSSVIYHVLCAFPRIVDDLSYCPALRGQNRRSGRLVLEQRLVHNVPGGRTPLHSKDMAETVSVVVGRG